MFSGGRMVVDGTIIIGGVLSDGFWSIDLSGKDTPVAAIAPVSFADTYTGYDPGYVYPPSPATPYYVDGNDTYNGGGGSSRIDGKGGSDTLYGNGGTDVITGGDGNDLLNGGADDDRLTGGGTGFSFGGGAGKARSIICAENPKFEIEHVKSGHIIDFRHFYDVAFVPKVAYRTVHAAVRMAA